MRLLIALVAVATLAACAPPPKPTFDAWIARSGWTFANAPVPCDRFPTNCGGTGQVDVAARTVYVDGAQAIAAQPTQDAIDPTINVFTQVYYHEWSHVADIYAGFVEGVTLVGLEHAAQCGMELITGRTWTTPLANPAVYWDCPDGEIARTRWIWTARGII